MFSETVVKSCYNGIKYRSKLKTTYLNLKILLCQNILACPYKQSVIDTKNKSNSRNKAVSIFTFDLPALYTNIPYVKLKSVMRDLISFYCSGSDKEFTGITRCNAFYTNS